MPENLDIFHYLYLVVTGFLVVTVVIAIGSFQKSLAADHEGEEDQPDKIPLAHINFADTLLVLLLCGFWTATYFTKDHNATYEITSSSLADTFIIQLILVGVVSLVWCFRVNLITAFGLNRFKPSHLFYVIGMLAIVWLAAYSVIPHYASLLEAWGIEAPLQDSIQFLQESEDYLTVSLFALVAVIGAPLFEETLFRGYIFPTLKRFSGLIPALLCSGLFFSIIHNNLFGLPLLFLFGVLLALAYDLTRTLWVPILGHMIFNAVTVMVQVLIKV